MSYEWKCWKYCLLNTQNPTIHNVFIIILQDYRTNGHPIQRPDALSHCIDAIGWAIFYFLSQEVIASEQNTNWPNELANGNLALTSYHWLWHQKRIIYIIHTRISLIFGRNFSNDDRFRARVGLKQYNGCAEKKNKLLRLMKTKSKEYEWLLYIK